MATKIGQFCLSSLWNWITPVRDLICRTRWIWRSHADSCILSYTRPLMSVAWSLLCVSYLLGKYRIDFGASYMRFMRHEQLCFAASLHDNGCAISPQAAVMQPVLLCTADILCSVKARKIWRFFFLVLLAKLCKNGAGFSFDLMLKSRLDFFFLFHVRSEKRWRSHLSISTVWDFFVTYI